MIVGGFTYQSRLPGAAKDQKHPDQPMAASGERYKSNMANHSRGKDGLFYRGDNMWDFSKNGRPGCGSVSAMSSGRRRDADGAPFRGACVCHGMDGLHVPAGEYDTVMFIYSSGRADL